ncbi:MULTISPECIES: ABC transporter ATP-binding protein [Aerococcus]|uniref:ABC transporter ATP-binding protein n=1 Tax=Aerococcus sanguinicola TaxID=119206 RepID=A0A5N1GNG4_9LACT|nr:MULTISPECIES: ABC transporter ATP-binding protein [Aerococcus]KAA9301778.1 ABC transporter ATP-binding protein [Aerococcus sanguinicola]MDK6368804.1 ABC transporter ATP-binding protein [Aerococcus sp. UMB9870]MDK6679403.1 ABC transporter ATP-binding protein [Aerococcus sp. UMB8608]MDK6685754.1 ABC transporter ATP-binding protein [Aerococcus sp. UMB8623]MDK6939427.1 ABC transporter ATP-binding protein [Aerococcus sp. UMB8487]
MLLVEDLQVKYGDFVAIDGVNLEIQDGEFFTLLGPSGCGKTTTLRAIAGFQFPSKGKIILNDRDLTHVPVEKRELGMVFQSYALFPTMSVYDNIAYGLEVKKVNKADIEKRVMELAELVDMTPEQLQKNVSELSGGQQQRVAIARALAMRPDVVLFDEPLSNLDAKLRKQLRVELKRIQRETGMTAIYVTHDQEEALELSDHIAVFNKGFIEQIGTPEEIYNHSATEFVCDFIGESNRLDDALVQSINEQIPGMLDPKQRHYIRPEKIRFYTVDGDQGARLTGTVQRVGYKGSFSSLFVDVNAGKLVEVINKEDRNASFGIGDRVDLILHPEDILSYEVV